MARKSAVLVGLLTLGATLGAAAAARWEVFTAYPGARSLCQERVYSSDLEIHWQTHATADPLATVVGFYEKQGLRFTAGRDGSSTVKQSEVTLTVYPAAKQSSFPSCASKPAAPEQTVLFVHRGFRRR